MNDQNQPLSDSSYSRLDQEFSNQLEDIISIGSSQNKTNSFQIRKEDETNQEESSQNLEMDLEYSYQEKRILDTDDNKKLLQSSSIKSDLNCMKYISQNQDENQSIVHGKNYLSRKAYNSDEMDLIYQFNHEDLQKIKQGIDQLDKSRDCEIQNLGSKLSQKQYFSEASLSPEKPLQFNSQLSKSHKESQGLDSIQENSNKFKFEHLLQNDNLFVGCLIKNPKSQQQIQQELNITRDSQISRGMSNKSYSQASLKNIPKSPLNNNAQKENKKQKIQQFKFMNLFTSQQPSQFLINIKNSLKISTIEQVFSQQQDYQKFQQINSIVNSIDENKQFPNAFAFDYCINENQDQDKVLMTQKIKSFLQPQNQRVSQEIQNIHSPTSTFFDSGKTNDIIILFGQSASGKSDLLNLNLNSSFLNEILPQITSQIKYLRVTMFYLDTEFTLFQKSYHQMPKSQATHDMMMDLRQSFRTRAQILKQIHSKKNHKNIPVTQIRDGSHLVIQVNSTIFLDLACIESLKEVSSSPLVQTLTMNFNSVTNEILKLSPVYHGHRFDISENQEQSSFHQFLSQYISQESKVVLLCCVTAEKDNFPQTIIALDYCQKIKCYFNGVSEEELQSILNQQKDLGQSQEIGIQIGQLLVISDQLHKKILKSQCKGQKITKSLNNLKKVQEKLDQFQKDMENMNEKEKTLLNFANNQVQNILSSFRSKEQRKQAKYPINIKQFQPRNLNRSTSRYRSKSKTKTNSSAYQSMQQNQFQPRSSSKSAKPSSRLMISNSKEKIIDLRLHKIFTPKSDCKIMTKAGQIGIQERVKSTQQNTNCLVIDQEQALNLNISKTYENLGSPPSEYRDPRDTPQFQEEQKFQSSSLYIRTSANSSHFQSKQKLESMHLKQILSAQNKNHSHLNSFDNQNQHLGSLYYDTEQSIDACGEVVVADSQNNIREKNKADNNFAWQQLVHVQHKLKSALSENEMLSNLKVIYEKQIQNLQDQLKKSEQNTSRTQAKIKNQDQNNQNVSQQQIQIDTLKMQIQSQDLKKGRLEAQIKNLGTTLDDKDREIEQLRKELSSSNSQIQGQKEINQQIIMQIKVMKEVIEEFKSQENEKNELVLKLKQKDQKIQKLNELVNEIKNGLMSTREIKSHEEKIKKLEEENRILNEVQTQKLQEITERLTIMQQEYADSLEQNEEFKRKNESLEILLRQTEKAKENFKDQTIDLKQELKHLKSQLKENAENIDSMKFEAKERQKTMVLGDIKNLIKDYKNEKKLNTSLRQIQ